MHQQIFRTPGIVAIATLLLAATSSLDANAERFRPGEDNIATIAIENGNFTTLVEALGCTGLVPAVADPDARLTVFAPTDEAFAAAGLNADNICSALSGEALTDILLYHVTEGRRLSPSVVNGRNKQITMLNGQRIFPVGSGSLAINANQSSVNIAAADILASNGVIHVIDFVLLP